MKKIVITGGSSGVGFSIAKDLSKNNNIIIVGRSEEKLRLAQKELGTNVIYKAGDLSTNQGRNEIISFIHQKFNHIDVLLHCAGVYPNSEQENIDNNLLSHYYLTIGLSELLVHSRVLIVTGNPTAIKNVPICSQQANDIMRAAWAVTHKTLLVELLKNTLIKKNTTINSFFPGDVHSELMPYTRSITNRLVPVGKKLALNAEYEYITGKFFDNNGKIVELNSQKYNERIAIKYLRRYITEINN